MIDIVNEVTGLRRAYARMRGSDQAKGDNIFTANTLIPRTKWADVMLVASHLQKYIDPTREQCIEIVKARGVDARQAWITCEMNTRDNPRFFQRTSNFNRAQENFKKYSPTAVAARITGSILSAPTYVISKVASGEIFPNNEEFWGYATRYAIARNAAGAVPFWSEIAFDSIKEAVEELPDTVQDAASAAFDAIDPSNLIPDMSGITELIKWGSIAGGLGLLYWYVLRPRNT